MNYRKTLCAALSAALLSPAAFGATEIYTSRAAFEARVAEINNLGIAALPLESQDFSEAIPGSNASDGTGPAAYTFLNVPLAAAADGFGIHTDAGALAYQANGGSQAPLVIETSVPVNALGFDVVGFGSTDIDPFFICFPPDYQLQFTGGDVAGFVVDTEVANGNGDAGNSQFFGIVDVDSPFTQIELNNTGFFEGAICGFSGTEDDVGDRIRVDDLSFGVAAFDPACGDVDDNRTVDGADVDLLRDSLAGLATLAASENCSVINGADSCDIADAVVLERASQLGGALPGIADVCRSNNLPPADIAAGLVGYWPFDEDDGTAVSHSPRGTRLNAPPTGDAARTTGRIGNALSLPDVAVDGYHAVDDTAAQAVLEAGSELTIATWLRPTGPGASPALGGTIVSKAGEYDLFRRPDGTLRWQKAWGTQPADVDFGISAVTVPTDTWTHVAITFDLVEARLYINGQFEESWPITAGFSDNVPANDTLRIGSSASAAGRQYEGDIDETAIWLRALDAGDVAFLYDNGFGRKAHEWRVLAANLDVAAGNVWSVTETASAGFGIATNTVNLGDVTPTYNGEFLFAEAGLLMPTVRETRTGPSANLPLATAYAAGLGAQTIAMTDMEGATGNEVNARVSMAFFPFAEGWIGGRVLGNGTLNYGNGVSQANVTRIGVGIYNVTIPGVTDARAEGMLYAVDANNGGDNVVISTPIGGMYRVHSYDNDGNFGSGQDVAWNFVYIPYDAPNLAAAEVDQLQMEVNGTGNSFVDPIVNGVTEITIPGEHYRRGVLLLGGGYTTPHAQDNLYTYAPGGGGRFVVNSRDLPTEVLQNAQYVYAYINFDRPIEMP